MCKSSFSIIHCSNWQQKQGENTWGNFSSDLWFWFFFVFCFFDVVVVFPLMNEKMSVFKTGETPMGALKRWTAAETLCRSEQQPLHCMLWITQHCNLCALDRLAVTNCHETRATVLTLNFISHGKKNSQTLVVPAFQIWEFAVFFSLRNSKLNICEGSLD